MSLWRGMALGLWLVAAAHAVPAPPAARAEIDYLLTTVAHSGCDFFRNGTWYDSQAAAAHLRFKYEALLAKNMIADSADFIEKAGTRSSVSGRAYLIKCKEAPEVSSHDWLTILLRQYRQSHQNGYELAPAP